MAEPGGRRYLKERKSSPAGRMGADRAATVKMNHPRNDAETD